MHYLKSYREQAGLTQQELAKLAGVRQPTLSQYESGGMPGLNVARRLVKALNECGVTCALDDVFPETESASSREVA